MCRLVVGDELAAIDVTVADPVLERDAPLPSGLARGGAGEWGEIVDRGARYGQRPVARKVRGPIDVWHAQRLTDQQAAEPRAVDEQVAGDLAAILELHRGDVAALRDRKSTRLNSSHVKISYAVFCY